MNSTRLIAAFGVCAGLMSPLATSAATYDVAADWSTTANPNGPWSYLHGTTLLPNQPTSCCGLPAVPSFAPSAAPGSFLPWFGQVPGSGEIQVHSYDPFNGAAALGEAVLAWTAPDTGLADISGYFYYGQYTDRRSNDVTIRLGATVLGSAVLSYFDHQDSAHRWNFAFDNLAVTAGDMVTVTFQRSAGYAPGSGDAGNMVVNLTPVPEPATYMLLLAGLTTLALARRQRPS